MKGFSEVGWPSLAVQPFITNKKKPSFRWCATKMFLYPSVLLTHYHLSSSSFFSILLLDASPNALLSGPTYVKLLAKWNVKCKVVFLYVYFCATCCPCIGQGDCSMNTWSRISLRGFVHSSACAFIQPHVYFTISLKMKMHFLRCSSRTTKVHI